jgi:hypothetical protein
MATKPAPLQAAGSPLIPPDIATALTRLLKTSTYPAVHLYVDRHGVVGYQVPGNGKIDTTVFGMRLVGSYDRTSSVEQIGEDIAATLESFA